jgi:hypothetical protein
MRHPKFGGLAAAAAVVALAVPGLASANEVTKWIAGTTVAAQPTIMSAPPARSPS